ncbi:quinoprotein dehydrogenase-associated SoxYZ-like carrier [Roseobacter cerasinus]|uniref:Quinoprotein dehydrogenase-associated SoxYZ-like carrier n=1 Tax=Roseobacter cerasinus TaxID=2602289 RepID=A0A640VW72_9RHOB|nr:quinoprotein dehydrogenase-associated SoxYZ-like carrier [Roseobacter cerasinus]GFE52279.1 quinoprotein dehydrogenase-associated SoxYZ-like carrier [Roseobacter cerasinus]
MKHLGLTTALLCCTALPALASNEAWDSVREQLYGDRVMLSGQGIIAIDAPYRTYDDARTDLAAQIIAPPGVQIAKVTVVLDENPMPVSAVFDLAEPQPGFYFDITMRVNGPTPMHVIAEATDGRLFVSETFVKTSGQGACAAPPGTDPELALASLGQMSIDVAGTVPGVQGGKLTSLASRLSRMDVDISHPSHSGMQMDQISLLFIPMRYVENVDIDLDGAGFVEMTGSISLSENPRLGLAVPQSTRSVDVTMTDTDGAVAHAHKDLAGF